MHPKTSRRTSNRCSSRAATTCGGRTTRRRDARVFGGRNSDAADLGDDLCDFDRATQQVDVPTAEPGQLADSQPAVAGDEGECPVARLDSVREPGDLLRREEAHFLPLHAGQCHAAAGGRGDQPAIDGRAEKLAEELVDLADGRGSQSAARQRRRDPGHNLGLRDRGELPVAEDGQDMIAEHAFVPVPGAAPQGDGRWPPLRVPIAQCETAESRVGPFPSGDAGRRLGQEPLGFGPLCKRS
jgi:hypothetical protein